MTTSNLGRGTAFTYTPTMGYDFVPPKQRAQCLYVVDGDTVDLFVDKGHREYGLYRFRLLGIDTPEKRGKKAQPKEAKEDTDKVIELLRAPPLVDRHHVDLKTWTCLVQTQKPKADSFGRWLADLWVKDDDGKEIHVNGELLDLGLAVPYVGR